MHPPEWLEHVRDAPESTVLVLTGAGISAESGIPTFRGPEGYWKVGSRNYRPEEMATYRFFSQEPLEVWRWYLHRRHICRQAAPNAAHRALVQWEKQLTSCFRLVTQNVDGLHLQAGSDPGRIYQIHGNLFKMRCAAACHPDLRQVPEFAMEAGILGPEEAKRLRCTGCGAWMRPHVLWFDESYDDPHNHFESALRAASEAALLVSVGTSGATTLPQLMLRTAAKNQACIIDVNPEDNAAAELASRVPRGMSLRGPASLWLPKLVEFFLHQTPKL